jgi:hypothetical protein
MGLRTLYVGSTFESRTRIGRIRRRRFVYMISCCRLNSKHYRQMAGELGVSHTLATVAMKATE